MFLYSLYASVVLHCVRSHLYSPSSASSQEKTKSFPNMRVNECLNHPLMGPSPDRNIQEYPCTKVGGHSRSYSHRSTSVLRLVGIHVPIHTGVPLY